MIRKSGSRFSEKPALGPGPGGSCSNNNLKRDCPFPQISRALDASAPLGKARTAPDEPSLTSVPGRSANKKPGPSGPGFSNSAVNSSGGLEQLVGVGLDRLDGLRRDLLRQLGEFLAPGGESLELLLGVTGPQLERLGRRLHGDEFLREIERSAGVDLEDFHQLGGILAGALAGA